jgi:rfaE bifunctional protein kinase chain/domain
MNLKVIVIGDVMLDQYLYGTVRRKSPEADIPVLDQLNYKIEVGGAANVALNAKLLDCDVHLVGVVGQDEKATKLESILHSHGIKTSLIEDHNRPTTVKTRLFNGNEQLVRVDEESTEDIDDDIQSTLINKISDVISEEKYDIAILQDYNKGVFCNTNIIEIITLLKSKDIFIGVDPKKENFECYKHVDLFKPNLNELKQWAEIEKEKKYSKNWVEKIGTKLRNEISAKTVLITLSEHGVLYLSENKTFHKPSIPIDVVDVCGAGDAVMMVSAIAAYKNKTGEEILSLCVRAGKIVCLKVGVSSISSAELHS